MFQNKQFELANDTLGTSVVRLSLEKLDKIRNRASKCLDAGHDTLPPGSNVLIPHFTPSSESRNITPYYKHEASSYEYFYSALSLLDETSSTELHKAILQGYISSAGMGSEATLQASRQALIDYSANLPIDFNRLKNGFSLGLFSTLLMEILEDSLTEDRILIPLLETLEFLMDMQIMQRMASSSVLPTGSFKYALLTSCSLLLRSQIMADGESFFPSSKSHTTNPTICKSYILRLTSTETLLISKRFGERSLAR
jgi:hypothetical protein